MNKLYTLKFSAVFDRHGEEYSLEAVFFAQDRQGRTYLYAENHVHNRQKEMLSKQVVKCEDRVVEINYKLGNLKGKHALLQGAEKDGSDETMEDLANELMEVNEFLKEVRQERDKLDDSLQKAVTIARRELQEVSDSANANGVDEDDMHKISQAQARLHGAEMLALTGVKVAEFVYDRYGGLIAERLQGESEFTFTTFVPRVIVHSKTERFRYPVPKETTYGDEDDPEGILLKGILYTHKMAKGAPFGMDWSKWSTVLVKIELAPWGVFDKNAYLTTDAMHYAVDEDMVLYCLFKNKEMQGNGKYFEVAFSVQDESMIGFRAPEAKWFSRMNYSVLRTPSVVKTRGGAWVQQDMKFFLNTWMKSHVSSKTYPPRPLRATGIDEDNDGDLSLIHSSDDEETKKKKRHKQYLRKKKGKIEQAKQEAKYQREKQHALPHTNATGSNARAKKGQNKKREGKGWSPIF